MRFQTQEANRGKAKEALETSAPSYPPLCPMYAEYEERYKAINNHPHPPSLLLSPFHP